MFIVRRRKKTNKESLVKSSISQEDDAIHLKIGE